MIIDNVVALRDAAAAQGQFGAPIIDWFGLQRYGLRGQPFSNRSEFLGPEFLRNAGHAVGRGGAARPRLPRSNLRDHIAAGQSEQTGNRRLQPKQACLVTLRTRGQRTGRVSVQDEFAPLLELAGQEFRRGRGGVGGAEAGEVLSDFRQIGFWQWVEQRRHPSEVAPAIAKVMQLVQ